MDFILTEEQKQIKALIKQFCEKEIDLKKGREIGDRAHLFTTVEETRAYKPVHLLEKLNQVGLRQFAVPKKYGGGGAERDILTLTISSEEFGRWGAEAGFGMVWNSFFNCSSAANNMTEEQQDWFFPQFMANHAFSLGGATSEPTGATDIHLPYDEGGSEVLKVFARKDGHEWVINGNKMFGSGIALADMFMVIARTKKEGPVSQSASAFWVPKEAPGLTIIPNRVADIAGNCQTFYDNVRVPETHLSGKLNKGFDSLMIALQSKTMVWAALLGWTQQLYDELRDFLRERVQGGKPLIKHSYVEFMLGQIAVDVEATRALTYRAAWEIEQALKAGAPTNLYWSQAVLYQVKNMMFELPT